jgi:hypothetical protein
MEYDKTLQRLRQVSYSKTKRWSCVAAFAVVKVCLAEGALSVVAGHAALSARVGEMLRGEGRANLSALRQSTTRDCVATIAVETLARGMIGVAEAYAVGARVGGSRSIASGHMTRAAG